jgi:hypothetical protein
MITGNHSLLITARQVGAANDKQKCTSWNSVYHLSSCYVKRQKPGLKRKRGLFDIQDHTLTLYHKSWS